MKRISGGKWMGGMVWLGVLLLCGWMAGAFGHSAAGMGCTVLPAESETVSVPILMYHNFAPQDGSYTVSKRRLRSHLAALEKNGYTAVTFGALLAYADGTGELPEKPVVLVSDDGYTGVLTYALPVLEEYEVPMSVAVIGGLIGVSGEGRLPHFTMEELSAADTEGWLEPVSHSWGLHGDGGGLHGAVNLTLPAAAYTEAVLADCARMQALAETYPGMGTVFVYPFGAFSPESEALLRKAGYRVTVTTEIGVAQIGVGESLTKLPRIPAEWYSTGEALTAAIAALG